MVELGHTTKTYPGQLRAGCSSASASPAPSRSSPTSCSWTSPSATSTRSPSRTLRRELHELWDATGKTVLFVTHDVSEAVELSTRILLFGKGGRLMDDIGVDLPFPRDGASDEVALAKAELLRKFESLDLVAT